MGDRLHDGLPADDFLVAARRADLDLARQITLECRRPEVPWAHDVTGPTEAWRDYLAENDPEWTDEPSEFNADAAGVAA